jgi:hypothetical protein
MAYLDPQNLTCPGCGQRGEITWVVGIGPQTRPGQGPSYRRLHKPGPWRDEVSATGPFWAGRLICPTCEATVLERAGAGNAS